MVLGESICSYSYRVIQCHYDEGQHEVAVIIMFTIITIIYIISTIIRVKCWSDIFSNDECGDYDVQNKLNAGCCRVSFYSPVKLWSQLQYVVVQSVNLMRCSKGILVVYNVNVMC